MHYTPLNTAHEQSNGYVVVAHDISARKKEEQRVRELTRIDALTDLLNRSGFDERLRDASNQAPRRR